MRRFALLLILATWGLATGYAQQEQPTIEIDNGPSKMASYQEFGGFVLDLTQALASPLALPKLELPSVDPFPKFKQALQLGLKKQSFRLVPSTNFQQNSYGFSSWGSSNLTPLHSATFRINERLNISTYGDYDAQGFKRPNPAALPWEKNDFRGGFEIKTSSGFRFGIEVNRKGSPYGYW